jgi:hypothetical protein
VRRWILTALATAAGAVCYAGAGAEPASAGVLYVKACSGFGDPGNAADVDGTVWAAQGPSVLSEANRCAQGGSFQILPDTVARDGANAQWATVTPPSIGITGAFTPPNEVLVEPPANNQGFQASFFWSGGLQSISALGNCCGGMDYGLGINRGDLNGSRYFGFQVSCQVSPNCQPPTGQLLDVKGIELTAQDNTPPAIKALGLGSLWYEAPQWLSTPRWVRGIWPLGFSATDDSGVCGMSEAVDGQSVQGPSATPTQSSWTQCPTPQTMNASVNTASYPDGPMTLSLSAADAASPANLSSPSETVSVDNSPVSVSLAGPADALSTAGTQYVDATASAGPSGVSSISCSADGSPFAATGGETARVPIQGVGPHTVQCYAENHAIDSNGTAARSPIATWNLSIRQPAVSGVTFGTRLLDALRCQTVTVKVRRPARWVTIHRHGRPIWVRRHAHTSRRREVRCHPRVAIRKVRVRGRMTRRRVVLWPHRVQVDVKHVAFGQAATVSGWVGLADGTALSGVAVKVITATENGLGRWQPAATVTTTPAGLWQATLPPGPSRLVAAVYPGSGTTESATSGNVQLVVPTKVELHIRPRSSRWGHTIRISGRVLGGDIPAGKLLRLRIGTEGIYSTVGIPDIDRRGRYHTTWTFAPGHGVIRYWFSVSTLPEADYPYAQTSSPRVYVTVRGG